MDYALSLLREPAVWALLVAAGCLLVASGSPAVTDRLKQLFAFATSRQPPTPAPIAPRPAPTAWDNLPNPINVPLAPAPFEPYDTALRLRRWLQDNRKADALKAFDTNIWPSLLPVDAAPKVNNPAEIKKGDA